MHRPLTHVLCILTGALALALPAACSGDDRSHEEQVCLDTVDEFTDAVVTACGADPATTRQQVLASFRSCEGVVAIRDEDELYNDCFPALHTLPCSQFETGPIPTSCEAQILFP